MADAIQTADKNWREANRIGDRLGVTAEDILNALPKAPRTGHITLREDMTVQVSKKNL